MRKLSLSIVGSFLVAWAATLAAQPAAAPPKAEPPKWKAIWEPANYPQDLNLRDVQFISAEEGWAVGDKNTVLHTTDGAKTWQVQLGGDTESSDRELWEVFFLDAKVGWVRGGAEKLMRTTDGGASWEDLGRLSQHELAMNFVSPQTGFTAGSVIKRTDDGGKNWKQAAACAVNMEVDGLARKMGCYFRDMTFPSAAVGYAVGQTSGSSKPSTVVARTKDGGETWTMSAPEKMDDSGKQGFFWSENDGLVTTYIGKTLITADGGETWTGAITPFGGESARYAMAGGKLGVIIMGKKIAYSTNGGRNFSSRDFPVPANVNAVTFPDATHGYLVGDHGMIYRYHIVPITYSAKGMIAAPMVGGK